MPHPRRLIPPPSGGSFGCFTSPTRGRAKSAFRLDSESQEDRGGPQPTSSEGGRGDVFAAAALWFAYIGRRLQTGGRVTPPALMSAPQAVPRRGRRVVVRLYRSAIADGRPADAARPDVGTASAVPWRGRRYTPAGNQLRGT